MSLAELRDRPYELLLAMEARAREQADRREGEHAEGGGEWIGVGFRLSDDRFVTDRVDVREVLAMPEPLTRIPGAKSWLRGIANVRGQLITIVDLKAYLGGGITLADRRTRILAIASRDVPTGLLVDEVLGFRRFGATDHRREQAKPTLACEPYLDGSYRRGAEVWPYFRLSKLLADERFLSAGTQLDSKAG